MLISIFLKKCINFYELIKKKFRRHNIIFIQIKFISAIVFAIIKTAINIFH